MIVRRPLPEKILLPVVEAELEGVLSLPASPEGLVVLAFGTSASRHSRRIQEISLALGEAGLGTVVVDLLTSAEDRDYTRRYDIPLLADRLRSVIGRIRDHVSRPPLGIGVLSASTGTAAALWTASDPESDLRAIVACEGRPDLVEDLLPEVTAPTLLVAGANGGAVTRLNAEAYSRIAAPKDMIVVPGAANPFEEPVALATVIHQAIHWFLRFLPDRPPEERERS
jgi:putative phosphoribosyl transferase